MNKINIIKGIINSKFLKKPFYVHLYITRTCNLKCKMCNVRNNKDKQEMNLDEVKIAAEKIKKMGTKHIVITGGEPLLRNDIYDVVKIFSDLNISVRLQTNGLLLTNKKIQMLVAAGLNDFTISLDTLDNEKQDNICGVKNVKIPERVTEIFKKVKKIMPKNSMNVASIVVSHKNLEEIPKIIKQMDSLGIWSTLVPVNLAETTKEYLFKASCPEFRFSKEDKGKAEKVYTEIMRLKKRGYKVIVSTKFLKQSLNFIKYNNKKWKCDAGELYFSIFPMGQYSPCDEVITDLNILDENFLNKIKSKKNRKFINELQNNCEGCFYGCWHETSNLINNFDVIFDRFASLIRVKLREILT